MGSIPTTVVDNFFDDPDFIRKTALSLQFESGHNCPGVRAFCPKHVCELVSQKLVSLLIDLNVYTVDGQFDMYFQLSNEKFKEGWVHFDSSAAFAGVIYLTPGAPIEAGTSFYKMHLGRELRDQTIKEKTYRGAYLDFEEFEELRAKNNADYYKTLEVGNVYNRMVMYSADEFHSENKLFGTNKDDARLTLVFFARRIGSNGMFPIDRMKSIKERVCFH